MHCPKCMIRSDLWTPENWPELTDFPNLARIVRDHAGGDEIPLQALEERLKKSNSETLY